MKKILFIINPISGVGRQKLIEKHINKSLDTEKFSFEIAYTQYAKHAIEISKQAIVDLYDVVVAVGGDGTVNEVSQGLIDSSTALAIIPTGSGNGLARFLKIPLAIDKAMQTINNCTIKEIDTIRINDTNFVNMAGVGFDGHISHKFAKHGKRGVFPYFKLVVKEFAKYKSKKYTITIDGEKQKKRAFVISFANSSEYGFDAHIAPDALIDDGWIDVCFIDEFPIQAAPALGLRLFTKKMDRAKYSNIVRAKKITIRRKKSIKGHIDGEPMKFGKKVTIKIKPKSLRVITGKM